MRSKFKEMSIEIIGNYYCSTDTATQSPGDELWHDLILCPLKLVDDDRFDGELNGLITINNKMTIMITRRTRKSSNSHRFCHDRASLFSCKMKKNPTDDKRERKIPSWN